MAWRAMEAGAPSGGWGLSWKLLRFKTLQAASLERRTFQSPLASRTSWGDAVRSLTSAISFPRRAVVEKALSTASGPPTESSTVTRVRQKADHPPPQTETGWPRVGGALLLQSISADAAVACLQTLAVQYTRDTKHQQPKASTSDRPTAVLTEFAEDAWEAKACQKNSISTAAWPCGNAAAVAQAARSRDFVRDQREGIINGKEDENAEVCAARVLLQVCMKNKDNLSGQSVLKLLNAMLSLRLCNLVILTELADTIRRRLLRILPSDGVAAILCTYCYLCVAPRPLLKAAAVSHKHKRSERLPAPVGELISDAISELCVRSVSSEKKQAEEPAAIAFRIDACSRRGSELRSRDALPVSAASAGAACVALSTSINQGILSREDAQISSGRCSSRITGCDYSQGRLSHAGVIACAWALSKVPFLKRSALLQYLEKILMPIHLCTGGFSSGLPRTSSLETDAAWKRELNRIQNWGVTAGAFMHLPSDHRSRAALTIQREIVGALTNLRRLVLQNKSKHTVVRQVPPRSGLLAHERNSSSAHPYESSKRILLLEDIVSKGLRAVQRPSSKYPTDTGQADSSICDLASEKHAILMCPADAATICGATTSSLQLSSIHLNDTAPILESLYLLHHEVPFMFLLPANQLCYFLAAAQEGSRKGLDVVDDSRTLTANAEHTNTAPSATPAAPSLHDEVFHWLPASLLWALLLLPRITATGSRLFELMPSRILAQLLIMLSLLPGHLATGKHRHISLRCACDPVEDGHAVKHGRERHFPSCWQKDILLTMTRYIHGAQSRSRTEKQRTPSDPAEKDLDFRALINFEATLKKFSSVLCRVIVQRAPYFAEKDLVVSISAVKRLDMKARQLPISGQSWPQHPDFSRVLDCLVRALRRRRQRAEERHQSCLPRNRHPALVEIPHEWDAPAHLLCAPLNSPLSLDCERRDKSSPTKSGTTSVVTTAAEHGDERSNTATQRERSQKVQQRLQAFAATEEKFRQSHALSTAIFCDGPFDQGGAHDTEKFGAFSALTTVADTTEDTRVLNLVQGILRPCFLEFHVDKEALKHPLDGTGGNDLTAENSEKPSTTQPAEGHTLFVRKQPSLFLEKQTKGTSGDARERVNMGILGNCRTHVDPSAPRRRHFATKADQSKPANAKCICCQRIVMGACRRE